MSPKRTSSLDSTMSSESAASADSSSRTRLPTNTLIITPLPLPFFEPKVLDALRSYFASFSKTYLHRRSPYSPISSTGLTIANAPENAQEEDDGSESEEEPEGDLYSWVPLKSFRRAIVVYYSAEEAEAARLACDRLSIPETPRCPSVTLRAFRAPNTPLVGGSLQEEGAWYEGGYMGDEGEIRESPFHLRPPVTERNFLISPPGSPPVGWVAIKEEPPNEVTLADDLRHALEKVQRSRGEFIEEDDGEDSVLLIPESAAGVCVRVENWSARRVQRKKSDEVVRTEKRSVLSEMEDELDEELDEVSWFDDPMDVEPGPVSVSGSWTSRRMWIAKPAPASMPPLPTTTTQEQPKLNLLTNGLSTPGKVSIVPTARPPI